MGRMTVTAGWRAGGKGLGAGDSSLCARVNSDDVTGRGREKGRETGGCDHYFGVFTIICDKYFYSLHKSYLKGDLKIKYDKVKPEAPLLSVYSQRIKLLKKIFNTISF